MKLIVTLLFLGFSTACSTPQALKRTGYVWPPAPDKPRLEWVGSYASQYDFPQTSWDTLKRKLAGKEPAQMFQKPWGVASDGAGKVYIADTKGAVVLVYDFEARQIEAVGSGTLKSPMGVALDAKGNVYVADSVQNRLYVFDKAGKPLSTIGSAEILNWPVGIAVDDAKGRLYVVNGKSHSISVFSHGDHVATWGKRGSGDGEFNYPTDIDIDSKGNIVVADSMNARVQILDPEGRFIRKFGQRGDGLADFQMIKGVAVDRHSDNIYVTDGKGDKVMVFSPDGEPLMSFGRTHSVEFNQAAGGFMVPQDIDIDKNGKVYVVDSMNRRFQVFQVVDEEWLRARVEKIQKAERR